MQIEEQTNETMNIFSSGSSVIANKLRLYQPKNGFFLCARSLSSKDVIINHLSSTEVAIAVGINGTHNF